MRTAITHEIKKLYIGAHLPSFLIGYSVINLITFAFFMNAETVQIRMLTLLNTNLLLLTMVQTFHITRIEVWQGKLEYALSYRSAHQIFLTKFFSLAICMLPAIIIQDIAIYLTTAQLSAIANYLPTQLCLILQCSALSVMSISIQAFFRSALVIINLMIACFILPSVILLSLLTPDTYVTLSSINIGITFIITPLCYLASCYLFDNIYSLK